jgi:hypothetical protein
MKINFTVLHLFAKKTTKLFSLLSVTMDVFFYDTRTDSGMLQYTLFSRY